MVRLGACRKLSQKRWRNALDGQPGMNLDTYDHTVSHVGRNPPTPPPPTPLSLSAFGQIHDVYRDVGSDDVWLKITHCGVCYADVVWTRNKLGDSKYPLVPG